MRDVVDVEIESLDASGDGVGQLGAQRIRVPFTIPGERVRVRLQAARGTAVTAVPLEVLRPSRHRLTPRCPHFGPGAEPGIGPCGGCTWQHIAYPEQLRLKTALVDRVVREAVKTAPAAQRMIPGAPLEHPWGYRHKVHFVFGAGADQRPRRIGNSARGGALIMGHYVRGSRRVVPVRECPVHDERGNTAAFGLRDAYVRAGVPAAALRSVAIRVAANTPELMMTLVVADETDTRVRAATRRSIERAPPTGFHLNLHPKGGASIFGRETRRISGAERLREEVAGISFLVSPAAFFQTNVRGAEVLVRLVLEAVPAGARVLDLYAGAGLFALPLARAGHEMMAIEESRAAVADGEISLRLNRIGSDRCRFVARRVETALRDLNWRPDAVILDPPRDGADPRVLDAVFGHLRPATAVYISCNPEALGRDLRNMTRRRYTVATVQPVDMFPHTAHVETVVVLKPR